MAENEAPGGLLSFLSTPIGQSSTQQPTGMTWGDALKIGASAQAKPMFQPLTSGRNISQKYDFTSKMDRTDQSDLNDIMSIMSWWFGGIPGAGAAGAAGAPAMPASPSIGGVANSPILM